MLAIGAVYATLCSTPRHGAPLAVAPELPDNIGNRMMPISSSTPPGQAFKRDCLPGPDFECLLNVGPLQTRPAGGKCSSASFLPCSRDRRPFLCSNLGAKISSVQCPQVVREKAGETSQEFPLSLCRVGGLLQADSKSNLALSRISKAPDRNWSEKARAPPCRQAERHGLLSFAGFPP